MPSDFYIIILIEDDDFRKNYQKATQTQEDFEQFFDSHQEEVSEEFMKREESQSERAEIEEFEKSMIFFMEKTSCLKNFFILGVYFEATQREKQRAEILKEKRSQIKNTKKKDIFFD